MDFKRIAIKNSHLILIFISLILPVQIDSQSIQEKKHIVVLHSYHEGLPWSRGLHRGLDQIFSGSDLSLEIHIEYLDNLRTRKSYILDDLQKLYTKKFGQIEISALIVTDDPALNFILDRRDSFLQKIPVFFCGANGLQPQRLEGHSLITGIAENPDFTGTIKLIEELHAEAEEIMVISDRSAAGILFIQSLEQLQSEINDSVKFKIMTDESLPALKEELLNLPENTPVLFRVFLQDASGKTYGNNITVLKSLSSEVDLPFYTFKKIDIGHGALGGSVISEELMASLTAEMVLDYLNGTAVKDIPPIIETPQVFIFDNLQLKRFNIPTSRLPENSIIINQEQSFYQANTLLVWSISSVITLLVMLISFLALNIRRRLVAEMNLKLANEDLEQRVRERTDDFNQALLKAEAATEAKSNFLANMSHEIRTPMNAIVGLDSLLARTEMTAKQRDYVDKIGTSAKNLLGIINDILDFSKIEAGKLEIENTVFSLNDVLANLSGMIGEKTRDKGLELIFDQDMKVPQYLIGDPLRLGQILLNLTNNAIKFTDSGEIEVQTRVLEHEKDQLILRFSVRDTGIGLTDDQVGKLFQSFSQADTSTTRKYGGTGLGLSISKKLSQLMGGEIGVESEFGNGSTFFFTARLGISEGKKVKDRSAHEELKGLKVLVVDDNETAREVLTSYLEDFSFSVKSVSSGDLALRELIQSKAAGHKVYDLVFMDYQMPGLNGIETSRKIRDELENVEVPKIIMITGFGREEIMKQAGDVGLQGFLIKPVSPSMLNDTIMEAFGLSSPYKDRLIKSDEYKPMGIEGIRGAKLLLVEDNVINQQVAKEILEQEGFFVQIADDGKVAIAKMLENRDYDLILMDLQMPVMDGYEATEQIRKDNQFNRVPIVAMTADAMTGVQDQVKEAGMNDYVTKPINQNELWETLIRWIEPGDRELPESYESLKDPGSTGDKVAPMIEGIDAIAGLNRSGGNKDLYGKLLRRFVSDFSDFDVKIVNLLKEDKFDEALREAHTLKGVSANLGADILSEKAAVLEQGIKENLQLERLLEDVAITLQQTNGNIEMSGFLTEEEALISERTTLSFDELKEMLSAALESLTKRKPSPAHEILSDLEDKSLPDGIGDQLKECANLLDRYKMKETINILEKIIGGDYE